MHQALETFLYIIMILGIINLVRLGIFMIGADMYDIRKMRLRIRAEKYQPHIAVIIPAHNEEVCIIRTVESVLANDYARTHIVVVDDGSTDRTYSKLQYFKRKHGLRNLTIVRQKNAGKAAAINNALKGHVKGSSLVMVLDADSILDPRAITHMVAQFETSRVAAAAANVKVIDSLQPLTAAQRLEYVISHRMKRALTSYNMEYIVGGVGSTFRKNIVESCGYYDTDTMTEDIDFSMKIIAQKGNKNHRIIFASDVIAYTEGVISFKSLVRQRFRWKYGRMQTFFKNRALFFSADKRNAKQLTWFYMPFAVFSEFLLLIDPIIITTVLFASWMFGGLPGLLSVYFVTTFFYGINILADDSESLANKTRLMATLPFVYPFMLVMSLVDFFALMKSLVKLPDLFAGRDQVSHWQHVERVGKSVSL